MQEIKNRPFWTAPSELKRVVCHMLAAFSALNSGPTCLSLTLLIWIYMYDIFWSILYVPSCSLWGRELGQQVHMLWLFSQDFLKGSRACRRYTCRNVAWLHLAWAGVYIPPSPHPPTWSCMYAPLLAYVVTWCWWHATRWLHLVYGGLDSPPIHRLGRACALPFAYTIFNPQIIISNLIVKSNFQTADRHVSNVQNHIQ